MLSAVEVRRGKALEVPVEEGNKEEGLKPGAWLLHNKRVRPSTNALEQGDQEELGCSMLR